MQAWTCSPVVALVSRSSDSSVMMLLETQGRESCLLPCTVQAGWFHFGARVPESRWTGVSEEDKVNQADFGLAGGKQVLSEMLAALRLLNIIFFVLKG